MSIRLVMASNHFILGCKNTEPLSSSSPPAFNLSQDQGFFQWVSSLHQVAKILEFQLQYQSFQDWIFFRIDWFDLLEVQGTLKSLFQYHSSKASILWHSTFFIEIIHMPLNLSFKSTLLWSFPGGPVVKIPCFQFEGCRFDFWSGNADPMCCMEQHWKS